MKNIFRKNHIIITALAIMIVIAGYLSFSNKDTPKDTDVATMGDSDTTLNDEFTDVSGVDGLEVVTDTTGTGTDTTGTDADTTETGTDGTGTDTDTTGTDTTGTTDTNTSTDETGTSADADTGETDMTDISDQDILDTAQDVADNGELNIEDGVPGEAVLANAEIDASYFISTKLDREQVRARNKDTLMGIIESVDIAEADKQAAINSLIELTGISEKESATEALLEAKGFDGVIVYIVDGTVDVVVNAANLTDQQLAIIEDVVKEKTEIGVEHININNAVVQE